MTEPVFAAHYEALGLEPGASDQEIARAKRAYNELYHSDRLAHMSPAAQAIAALKVRAANEAARVLLDPSLRAARDRWTREHRKGGGTTPRPEPSGESPPPGSSGREVRKAAGGIPLGVRVAVGGVAVGALLGVGAFMLQGSGSRRNLAPAASKAEPAPTPRPPANNSPRQPAARAVADSAITVPADGRWTAPVPVGGPSFQASFIPEPDHVMYRVRTNGIREYVLNSEPGFRRITEDVRSYEFSSLTGKSFRVRYTRWRRDTPSGTALHTTTVTLPADGTWSQRIWLGPLGFRWDVDRPVGYEVRDDEGRIIRVPPSVRSVAFGKPPAWIRFRSTDSLPLSLTFQYTVP